MILTHLLIKTFGRPFYRQNAGFLIASFIVIFGYGLFIKTAGHTPQGQGLVINFILLLQFIKNPIICLFIACLWIAYTIRCWHFIIQSSLHDRQLFWRYSSTSFSLGKQCFSWMVLQGFLFIPLWIYWFCGFVYALFVGLYLLPLLTGLFILLLTIFSTFFYVYRFNKHSYGKIGSHMTTIWIEQIPKPLFSISLFQLIYHQKIALLITKLSSLSLILGLVFLLNDVDQPEKAVALMILTIAVGHSILIYFDIDFQETHLYFIQQFPLSRLKLFTGQVLTYLLLLLPEIGWFMITFDFPAAFQTSLLCISALLFIRGGLYITGLNMRSFLKFTFIYFFVSWITVLYNGEMYLMFANLLIAYLLFYTRHYKRKQLQIK